MIETSANLNEADYQMLSAGFIDRGLATAARLRRVDDIEGSEIVGRTRRGGTSYAGIAIPYFQPSDCNNPREYRLRRDQPDLERKGGGDLKEKGRYLSPPGRSNMPYFPPDVTAGELSDTKLPSVITEGEKKTLALCWKGGITYDHSRVSENREITITSGTLSIIGGIQPSRLQHYISEAYSYDNADGLPQRFLIAYPDARRQMAKPTQSDYEQLGRGLETAYGVFKMLAEKQFGGHEKSDSGDHFFPVQLDRDAQAAFGEWKDDTEAEAMRLESDDEVFASFLYKLPKSCAAIALIFHCIENINAEGMPDRIPLETTIQALAYIEVMTTRTRPRSRLTADCR
jgi:hypothetical protein